MFTLFPIHVSRLVPVVLAVGALTATLTAQSPAGPSHPATHAAERSMSSDFLDTVRHATARFKDVAQAEAEGYALMFGCVSGPDWGAMGLH